MVDLVGWLATALFVSSYIVPPAYLHRLQILGALTWTSYGVLLNALPIIVANLLVVMAAAYGWRRRRRAASLTR